MLQLNASHSSQGRAHGATEGAEQLSSLWQSLTKGQLQLFWTKEKAWKKAWKSGFWWNKKSWWTECILGQGLPAGALTFQNLKKPNKTKKPQSSTTASCANVRVQVACGRSNFSFLNVTCFLSGEKLNSPVAVPPCWLIYSLWLAFVSRKAICHFFCPWQRPLSVTQQPSESICQLICSTWNLLMPPAWKPFCRHCRFAR